MKRSDPKILDPFTEFVLDQMQMVPELSFKRMFGGVGFYSGAVFFAITFDHRLYFRTSRSTRNAYERAGMDAFRPNAKQTLGRYYEVPPHVVEDRDQLRVWARDAVVSAGEV